MTPILFLFMLLIPYVWMAFTLKSYSAETQNFRLIFCVLTVISFFLSGMFIIATENIETTKTSIEARPNITYNGTTTHAYNITTYETSTWMSIEQASAIIPIIGFLYVGLGTLFAVLSLSFTFQLMGSKGGN